jgi:CheY-like chemotaxis protein
MHESKDSSVLVVDDNTDAADTLAMALQFTGLDVQVAYSGHDAMEAAQAKPPAVAVLDIGMPEMDGYQLAASLRSALPAIMLIAHTGWGAAQDIERARAAGFDFHFTKPVDPLELSSVVAAAAQGLPIESTHRLAGPMPQASRR